MQSGFNARSTRTLLQKIIGSNCYWANTLILPVCIRRWEHDGRFSQRMWSSDSKQLAQKLPKRLLPPVWFLFLKSRCEQPTQEHDIPFRVSKFMFFPLQQDRSKSTKIQRIAALRILLVLIVLICCFRGQAIGDDTTARQRFVVMVSGVIRMNSVPATGTSEMSRVKISSASDVVLALSSREEPASSSDAVFLLHSGQSCHLSFRHRTGSLKVQTVSLSGQPCLELTDESTTVLTITSI